MIKDSDYHIKNEYIDGETNWVWPNKDLESLDGGLWLGPKNEWPKSKELILKHCSSFQSVVQAGGACGMYPRLMSKMFETVYTFEPHLENFFALVNNCKNPNIYKYQAALANGHQMISLNSPSPNMGMHTIYSHLIDRQFDYIPTLMIDDFQFYKLSLIYLDIEHSEIYALKGATKNIVWHKPLIVTENATKEIVDFLSNLGYIIVDKNVNDTFFKYDGG